MKNRLSHEPSPYLRQHQDNPVDWFPWGEEALAKAKAENKPILLSVGYSACHWCHVMAHESFENAGIAEAMNRIFINVKVDREERPDVDQLYQGVVQLMGRGGGWPLTVFLTPDLKPFFGGTYFPPEDRHGLPGFPRLLLGLEEAWTNKRETVLKQAEDFLSGLRELSAYGLDAKPAPVTREDLVRMGGALVKHMDPVNGGFGGAPKFPNPMNVALLLRALRRSGDSVVRSMALLTLEKMARGGLYDQLGGGFHRYSVDATWSVPHFEKMLYDNAQLLHLYAEGYLVDPQPLFKRVVEETVEYLSREMTDARGGFYASQDADSEGEEGKFFVWSPEEVSAVLPEPLNGLAQAHWGLSERGNFEHGRTVLFVAETEKRLAERLGRSVEEVRGDLAQARQQLFDARERRVKPGRDEKILAGWNGLTIRGLALAGRVFARPDWIALASRAADFVLSELWDGERLLRSHQEGKSRIDALLEDYGNLSSGLVALFQATQEIRYLTAAKRLAELAEEKFWDAEKTAYLAAPRGQKDLVTPTYALFDNAAPSGASTLTEAQVTLAALTGEVRFYEQAATYLEKLHAELTRNPMGFGHLALAADAWVDGAAELVIAGGAAESRQMVEAVNGMFLPTLALVVKQSGEPVPPLLAASLEGREPVEGTAAAYLCRKFVCELPVTSLEKLKERLTGFGTGAAG